MATPVSEGAWHRATWKNGWLLGTAIIFSFFVAVLSLTTPFFMLLVYDRVLTARSIETLTALLILAIILIIGMTILDYARRRVLARLGSRIQTDLEKYLLSLPLSLKPPGSSRDVGVEATDRLREFIHSGVFLNILDALWLPIYLGTIFLVNPLIFLLAIAGLIITVSVFATGRLLCSQSTAQAELNQRQATNAMSKTKDALVWLPGHGLGYLIEEWLLRYRAASRASVLRASDQATIVTVMLSMIRSLLTVIMLSAAASLVIKNQLTIGGMVISIVLLNRISTSFVAFLKALPTLKDAVSNWRKIREAFSSQSNSQPYGPPVTKISDTVLEIRDAHLDNPLTSQPIFQDINLTISSGEVVEIIGEPSSGKTTLAEIIVGARSIDRGTILIQGHLISTFTDQRFSKTVGYVPETPRFLTGSIARAISGPIPDINLADVENATTAAGLHSRIATMHDGYNTVIDTMGFPLGRSDRQLLALARALFNGPSFIVIDEPTPSMLKIFSNHNRHVVDVFLAEGGTLLLLKNVESQLPWQTRNLWISDKKIVSTKP